MPEPHNSHAPWKLHILIPLWLAQLVVACALLIATPIVANKAPYGPGMDIRAWMVVVMTVLIFVIVMVEISLFYQRKFPARRYLIAQWAKATLIGIVWLSLAVEEYVHGSAWTAVGSFAIRFLVYQHPAIIGTLYYGTKIYERYGGDAGAAASSEDATAEEAAPLLRDSTEAV